MPRSLSLWNTYTSATSECQYIGSAGDVVKIRPFIELDGYTILRDVKLAVWRSAPLSEYRDSGFSAIITQVNLGQPVVQQATSNGVATWILWTGGLSANTVLSVEGEVIA